MKRAVKIERRARDNSLLGKSLLLKGMGMKAMSCRKTSSKMNPLINHNPSHSNLANKDPKHQVKRTAAVGERNQIAKSKDFNPKRTSP